MDRILIIDDDNDLLLSFGHLLEERGFEIDTCMDGRKVMEKIRVFSPDLVLLDVFLNGSDGLSICRSLRSSEFIHDIPIIVVSGYSQLSSSATRGYGADAFFAKPFKTDDIVRAIQEIITRKRDNSYY